MKIYKDLDNNSDIESYNYDDEGFVFWLKDGSKKKYTRATVTFYELDCLKARADTGRDLDHFMDRLEAKYGRGM